MPSPKSLLKPFRKALSLLALESEHTSSRGNSPVLASFTLEIGDVPVTVGNHNMIVSTTKLKMKSKWGGVKR